jgi:hypothetical protein
MINKTLAKKIILSINEYLVFSKIRLFLLLNPIFLKPNSNSPIAYTSTLFHFYQHLLPLS